MASPSVAVQSPIVTPALLQHELPPWPQSTPSPWHTIRCPPEPSTSEPDGDAYRQQSGSESPVPDALWEVCRPYIQSMLQALHHFIQEEVEAQVQTRLAAEANREPSQRDQQGGEQGPGESAGEPFSAAAAFPALLHSGYDRSSEGELRDSGARGFSNGASRTTARGVRGLAQSVGSSSSKGSSKGSSPNIPGNEPPSSTGTLGAAGSSTLSSVKGKQWAAHEGIAGSSVPESKPIYLTRQDPVPSGQQGGRSGVAVSPLVPTTEPSRLSPLMPSTEPDGLMCMDDGAMGSEGIEKSVMVCRHWKSKGWCKLGDDCKFLHPEHKRGTGIVKKGGEGGAGLEGEGGDTKSRTRRAGRKNRRGAGSAFGAHDVGSESNTAVQTPGLVAGYPRVESAR